MHRAWRRVCRPVLTCHTPARRQDASDFGKGVCAEGAGTHLDAVGAQRAAAEHVVHATGGAHHNVHASLRQEMAPRCSVSLWLVARHAPPEETLLPAGLGSAEFVRPRGGWHAPSAPKPACCQQRELQRLLHSPVRAAASSAATRVCCLPLPGSVGVKHGALPRGGASNRGFPWAGATPMRAAPAGCGCPRAQRCHPRMRGTSRSGSRPGRA